MAYPQHWLFIMGGTLPGRVSNDEAWQCGIRCLPAAGSAHTYGQEDAVLASIATAVRTWFNGAGNTIRSDATLTYLKLNEINSLGKYAHPSTPHTYNYSPAYSGGAVVGPSNVPAYMTAAVTWRTVKTRGPGSHGRIYLPFKLDANSGKDYMASGNNAAFVSSAKVLLTAINNPSSGIFELVPCVVSKVDGTATPITSVSCGDVYDVQRRRKRQVHEQYATSVWP